MTNPKSPSCKASDHIFDTWLPGVDQQTCISGYGLTETSPTTHLLPPNDGIRKIGSIGVLLPNLEARLLVDGDGNGDTEANEGEAGELWLRGPTIMKVLILLRLRVARSDL